MWIKQYFLNKFFLFYWKIIFCNVADRRIYLRVMRSQSKLQMRRCLFKVCSGRWCSWPRSGAAVSLRVLLQPRGSAGFPVQSLLPCPGVSHLGFFSLVGSLIQRAILVNHVFLAILHSSSTIHSSVFLMARTLLEFT